MMFRPLQTNTIYQVRYLIGDTLIGSQTYAVTSVVDTTDNVTFNEDVKPKRLGIYLQRGPSPRRGHTFDYSDLRQWRVHHAKRIYVSDDQLSRRRRRSPLRRGPTGHHGAHDQRGVRGGCH